MTSRSSVVVWSSDWRGTNGQAIVTRRVVEGQPKFCWIHAIYSVGKIRSIPTTLRAAIVLWSALFSGKAKTVYLVCSRSEGGFLRDVPALLPAVFGTRVIVHAHGSDIVDLLSRGRLSAIARWLYRRCELIVPSAHLVPLLEEVALRKLYVCENFAQQKNEIAVDPHPSKKLGLNLLWNSNVVSSKGFFDVAESVALARANGHDVHFTSLGEPLGDNEKTLTQVTTELDLLTDKQWFTYLGRVTPEDAVQQTAKADVVALPSRYKSECQPLALIQAMCFGKRIIVADTPALQATIRDYPAIILTDPSPVAMALVLAKIISQKEGENHALDRKLNEASQKARKRFATTNFDASICYILENVHSSKEFV